MSLLFPEWQYYAFVKAGKTAEAMFGRDKIESTGMDAMTSG